MDIHTASLYMKHGYKVRRPCWDAGEYIRDFCGVIERCIIEGKWASLGEWTVYSDDLTAIDWELVLEDENVV